MILNKNLLVWSFNKTEGRKWIKFCDEIGVLAAKKEYNKIAKLPNSIRFNKNDLLSEVKNRINNMYYYIVWNLDIQNYDYDFLKE